jgi:hypothetical protein
MKHKAHCQCGQFFVESTDDPEFVLVCNCVQCQRRSGSAFALGAFFRREAVNVEGEYKKWTRLGSSGLPLTNHFCPECGTNLFWAPEVRPDHYGVAVGCLTSPVAEPGNTIWTSEKQPWLTFPEHWGRYQRSVADG